MSNPLSYFTIWNMIIPVLAAPINEPSNASAEPSEPPWRAEPTGRGSFGILLNCLLTLLLCVWTTIHIDFVLGRPWWTEFRMKLVLVIVAMLAPEIMLAVAGLEWVNARQLREHWCEAKSKEVKSEEFESEETEVTIKPGRKKDTFGMGGAYLVCMGGVAICLPDWLPNLPTIVLSKGIKQLWEDDPRKLSNIDQIAAKNKTKTDALGKTIVCVQGIWMVIQCITRKATGLPVTLLELHVAVHVICALIMYLFWWDKPHNIGEPVTLFDDIADACIYALKSADYDIELVQPAGQSSLGAQQSDGLTSAAQSPPLITYFGSALELDKMVDQSAHKELDFQTQALSPRECLIVDSVLEVTYHGRMFSWRRFKLGTPELHALVCTAKKYSAGLPVLGVSAIANTHPPDSFFEKLVQYSVDELLESGRSTGLAVGIILTYGACHAVAWNTHFPSTIECWLWRVSAIVVTVIPTYFIIFISLHEYPKLWAQFFISPMDEVYRKLNGRSASWVEYITKAQFWLLLAVLIFGRVFLLVESFISLRSLPQGSFKTTVWDDYWPHL